MTKVSKFDTIQEAAQAYVDPERPQSTEEVRVKIVGLRVAEEPGTFYIDGVRPREIDWNRLLESIGYRDESPYDRGMMCDKIGEVIWLDDLVKLLARRIER